MSEMTKQRPKFLDLTQIRQPISAKMSILHRITGGGIFIILPVLICLLQLSLGSNEDFETFRSITGSPLVKLFLLAVLYGFLHHALFGIRILLLDMHKGTRIDIAHRSSKLVLVASVLLTLVLGVALW